MKDDWTDGSFASNWDAAHLVGSPARPFLVSLVVSIVRKRAATDRTVSILEIGSGSGLVSAQILDDIPDVTIVGIDNSPPMMERAAERLARYGGRFRQIVADLESFDAAMLGEQRYDIVLVLQVLHEIPPAAKIAVLTALRDRIAPDGLVLYGERLRPDYKRFALPHEAVWDALCGWTPDIVQPGFAERVATIRAKDDFATGLAGELAAFAQAGYVVEPLVVLGDRCLLAAKPDGIAEH